MGTDDRQKSSRFLDEYGEAATEGRLVAEAELRLGEPAAMRNELSNRLEVFRRNVGGKLTTSTDSEHTEFVRSIDALVIKGDFAVLDLHTALARVHCGRKGHAVRFGVKLGLGRKAEAVDLAFVVAVDPEFDLFLVDAQNVLLRDRTRIDKTL